MIGLPLRDFTAVAATALAFVLYSRVNSSWFLLGWVGFVPFLGALDRQTTALRSLYVGWVQCVLFTLAVFGWFASAIGAYVNIPVWMAFVLLALSAPLLQPQFLTFAWARHRARDSGVVVGAVAGALTYVATEWAFPKLFADTLGHGLYASVTLRQGADLAGAAGLTLVVLLTNECLRVATDPSRWGSRRFQAVVGLCLAVALPLVLSAYGVNRYRELTFDAPEVQPVRAALVQANIGSYDRSRDEIGIYETVRRVLDEHENLSREALGDRDVDLLVWPETAYPMTFGQPKSETGAVFDREIEGFVADAGVPLLFGTYERDEVAEYNVAVLLESTRGRPRAVYRKARPFPLTERVPPVLDRPFVRKHLPWLGTWAAGSAGGSVMPVRLGDGRTLTLAPLIGLDAGDPGYAIAAVRAGAEVLVVLSNDGWFAESNGARLHLIVSAFRSLETRRPQLHATNSGISTLVTPTGEMVAATEVNERRVIKPAFLPIAERGTLMLAWGDWLGPVALFAAAGILAWAAVARRGSIK